MNIVSKELFQHMVRIRREIHMYPELGYQEENTATIITRELKRLGIEATTGIGKTGVIGRINKSNDTGPVVALRADMDALAIQEETGLEFSSKTEGVMHACGHDGHVAMLIGAASLLKESLQTGSVLLVFQPAEEGGGGAQKIMESGLLVKAEAIFACHLDRHYKTGKLVVQAGTISAFTDRFDITITGKGGHAAQPHDAVDAIVVASLIVMSLQTIVSREVNPLYPSIVSVGRIEGGSVPNAVAEKAKLSGTIRTTDTQIRDQIMSGITRIVDAAGTLHNAKVSVNFTMGYPSVINTVEESEIAKTAVINSIGHNALVDTKFACMGGEDFSYYLEKIPGCLVRLGSQKKGLECIPAHSSTFDFDEDALGIGAAFLAEAAKLTIERLS
ncbi:metal-dependent amidase/aminoacylase/carboxypeptidase [Candidatus Scalindua japonica]|uniref:Metal-dependent amidase/aminoacylase/carboxypeptidase n=1 Tax=Candidatus Scalindua japonica TaxID=1284222 RepID=A0A286U4F3_9BACT|nr:amidohydrolase [Candidatus Scalindua japonica]GAX63012.1 metal-dependent amidase/aminoacylase/carboxypeptidase [Candidatus Scalindua japonica]